MQELEEYWESFQEEIQKASTLSDWNYLKGKYVGKKSRWGEFLAKLKELSPEEKRVWGKKINQLKKEMEELLEERYQELLSAEEKSEVDITLPGKKGWSGSFHPVLLTRDWILTIFQSLGFRVEEGPEIETEFYNFEALNIPPDHPARDDQDSFYLAPGYLLRTHTSPAQIRVMEKLKPPFKVVVPGKCYRRDAFDATHSPMFHQIEGLVVARDISMGDLKGTLETFVRRFFGEERKIRFRPGYFPFTEPSAEVDVSCGVCGGKGCRSCGYSGWLEILGAGLVHPQVFTHAGYDSQDVRGFAFGLGVERITMLKFGIKDIRWFWENDVQFLEQFNIF